MKKRILLIVGLCLCAASFATAEGLEAQFGIGYYTELLEPSRTITAPIGMSAYFGLGYGFGDSQAFSLGFEIAPTASMITVSPPIAANLGLQGRIFYKYGYSKLFSITGFGGYRGSTPVGDEVDFSLSGNPVMGARITVLIIYLEYTAVMSKDISSIHSHDIGLGISIIND